MDSPMNIYFVLASLLLIMSTLKPQPGISALNVSVDDFPCHVKGTLVDCSNTQLQSVPSGIPERTTILILAHNRLSKLNTDSFKGLINLVTLDLSYNSISRIDSSLFVDQSKLQNLFIAHNQINKLSTTSFNNTKDLRVLDLSYQNNGMSKTSWDALQALGMLEKLSLEKVKLATTNFGQSVHLRFLKVLNIASNEISTINNGDFAALQGTRLELLDLSDNPLGYIGNNCFVEIEFMQTLDVSSAILPEMLQNLSQALSGLTIHKLVLQNIGLISINHNSFANMGNSTLQNIDFSHNNITKLEENSFSYVFQSLKQLNFYMNNIAHIDATVFTNLSSLRVLDLSNNSLMEITPTMFISLNGICLEELYLHKNAIQTISSERPFHSLGHLKYLKLSKNKIRQTISGLEFDGLSSIEVLDLGLNADITLEPAAFSNLSTLKKLYINVAHLKRADVTPSPFSMLRSLETLDLSNNSMASLSCNTFDDLVSLETLYLQHNNLKSVWDPTKGEPRLFLRNLSNLEKLDLSHNGFTNIPEHVFFNLTRLRELKLGRNAISQISTSAFGKMNNLRHLELQNNNINVVNKNILQPVLSSLVTISIGFNPFSCTCDLLWFRKWIDTTGVAITDINNCKCASPPDMLNKQIKEYHPNERECEHKLPLYAIIIIGIAPLLIIVVIFILYQFRSYFYYGYYLINSHRRKYELINGDDDEFLYDAFVSHSNSDKDWVENYLRPKLEDKEVPPFKLCLHYRDFEPGHQIVDNITDGVDKSRCTLCLISRDYLESKWCTFERKLAVHRLFALCKDSLIVIMLEDIPKDMLSRYDKIHRTLKKKTYLEWPEKHIERQNFWLRLTAALRGNRKDEDVNV